MASLTHARPLHADDGEALEPIDQEYALRHDLEPALTRSSLLFYTRSGHSFTAFAAGRPAGFALAQAVWNGTRPTVHLQRVAVAGAGDAHEVIDALLDAVIKSAYDSAVYDLWAHAAGGDTHLDEALERKRFTRTPHTLYSRALGSRGNPAAAEANHREPTTDGGTP